MTLEQGLELAKKEYDKALLAQRDQFDLELMERGVVGIAWLREHVGRDLACTDNENPANPQTMRLYINELKSGDVFEALWSKLKGLS